MSAPVARTPEGGYIGAPIPRREDARLLTGRGTFVDDLEIPGVVHAAMVRSPHAHARVRRVDVTAARALPGVLAVVTAADIADIQKPWPARMPSPVPGTADVSANRSVLRVFVREAPGVSRARSR